MNLKYAPNSIISTVSVETIYRHVQNQDVLEYFEAKAQQSEL